MQPYGLINNGLINHGLVGNGIIGPGLLNEIDDGLVIPFRSDALMYGCTVEDGQLIDKLGRSEFPSVIPAQAVGDGTWYGEVHYNDGSDFTDADLPDNYEIEIVCIPSLDLVQEGFYGFDNGGDDRTYLSKTNSNSLIIGVWSWVQTIGVIPNAEEKTYRIIYDNGAGFVYEKDALLASDSGIVRTSSGKVLQLLTQGDSANVGQHTLRSFKITNTDTNEVIMHFGPEEFSQVTDTTSAAQSRIQDATGNFYMQAILAPDDYIQQDINAGEGVNATGYTVAQALGKNLFNKDLATDYGVSVWYDTNGNIVSLSGFSFTETYYLINANTQYTISGTLTFSSSVRLFFFDKNKQWIGRSELFTDILTFTTPLNTTYIRVGYRTAEVDKSTIQLEEGTTQTTYEAWQGYYKDSGLTIPWEDGQIIPAKLNADGTRSTTECIGHIDDGTPPVQYTISTATIGNGTALVNGETSVTVDEGTALTFSTVDGTNYEFDSWDQTLPTTATADGVFTATFTEIPQFTILVASDGNGTAYVNGQELSITVYRDTPLTFTYLANSGYEFVEWTPAVPATATADGTYTASFQEADESVFTFIAGNSNYFDTGIIPDQLTDAEMDYDADGFTECLFGQRSGFANDSYNIFNSGGNYRLGFGDATAFDGSIGMDRLISRIYNGRLFNNDTPVAGTDGASISNPSNTIYVGCLNNNGSASNYASYKFYGLTIVKGGVTYSWRPNSTREEIEYYIDNVYQSDVTINGTVTSGQWTEETPSPGIPAGYTDVTTLGIVADDSTDNGPAIQAAFNAGHKLYFPNGTYRTRSAFTGNMDKYLAGDNATLKTVVTTGQGWPSWFVQFDFENYDYNTYIDGINFEVSMAPNVHPNSTTINYRYIIARGNNATFEVRNCNVNMDTNNNQANAFWFVGNTDSTFSSVNVDLNTSGYNAAALWHNMNGGADSTCTINNSRFTHNCRDEVLAAWGNGGIVINATNSTFERLDQPSENPYLMLDFSTTIDADVITNFTNCTFTERNTDTNVLMTLGSSIRQTVNRTEINFDSCTFDINGLTDAIIRHKLSTSQLSALGYTDATDFADHNKVNITGGSITLGSGDVWGTPWPITTDIEDTTLSIPGSATNQSVWLATLTYTNVTEI